MSIRSHIQTVRLVRESRIPLEAPEARRAIRNPDDAARLLEPFFRTEETECFILLALDSQHRVKSDAIVVITRGILNSSLVHPREVFRAAIALNAAAIIVAHNHPSGDPTPSDDDRDVTRQLVKAGKLLDIPLHDHLIIGAGRNVSFAALGLL